MRLATSTADINCRPPFRALAYIIKLAVKPVKTEAIPATFMNGAYAEYCLPPTIPIRMSPRNQTRQP